MSTTNPFSNYISRRVAVIPERVWDHTNGWVLSVNQDTLERLRRNGKRPVVIPLQTHGDEIDAGAYGYVRANFDDIHAPDSLKKKLADPQLRVAADTLVVTRREAQKEDFYRRVLVAPDLKNGKVRLSQRFATALRYGSRAIPVLATGENELDEQRLITEAAGFFLPGSDSNYHPIHYGGTEDTGEFYDLRRDRLVRAIVGLTYEEDIPLFGICSGIQGLAIFGKHRFRLHQDLGSVARHEHYLADSHVKQEDFRAANLETIDRGHSRTHGARVKSKRYHAAHDVHFGRGTFTAALMGDAVQDHVIPVNSSHRQAIEETSVSRAVSIDGTAPDGTIEALHDRGGRYILGVQFHPEALFIDSVNQHPLERKLYRRLFWAFEQAVAGASWRDIIHPRAGGGNWRNRGMARVYMTVPGSIQRTPEFVTGLRENVLIP